MRLIWRLVFVSALLLLWPGLRAGALAQPERQVFPSPGNTWVVESYTRDLGEPQTVVALHLKRQKVATYQDNILVVAGAHAVSVRWEPDASAVTIVCQDCDVTNAEVAVQKIEKIAIRYQTQ